jgi:hypothetical protein
MDQSQLTDAMLKAFGRNYRNIHNRWWVLLDGDWQQDGARERLRLATWRMCRDLWPQESGFPDYLLARQMQMLIPYLSALTLPGRPEHTEKTERYLGLEDPADPVVPG